MVYAEETGVVFEFSLWLLVTILLVSYDSLSSPGGFFAEARWETRQLFWSGLMGLFRLGRDSTFF